MRITIRNNLPAISLSIFFAILALLISPPLYADHPPADIFGNYTGTGQCPAGSAKTCANTGATDNVYIQRVKKKVETENDRLIREMDGTKKVDARIAIRILRDYGHSCAFEGDMYWSGDHLEFQEKPSPHGVVPSHCRLQFWFKHDNLTIRDPDNECGKGYCFYGEPITLAGRHFKKGSDPLLTAEKKSTTPPPVTIFGTYHGTGTCATDERNTGVCRGNKLSDYITIKPGKTVDARVVLGRSTGASNNSDYFCLQDANAKWFGNHLTFIKKFPDSPGKPHLLEFWFKGDTVVVRNIWNNHCGTYIQGSLFKKRSLQPARPPQLNHTGEGHASQR